MNHFVVLMTSRNKDNTAVKDFKPRSKTSLVDLAGMAKVGQDFLDFCEKGLPGEMSRLYLSVNARDEEKTRKSFLCYLVEHDDTPLWKYEQVLVSCAMKSPKEKKWLFDYDSTDKVEEFCQKCEKMGSGKATCHKTPNGYAVVTEHGFDTRELMKWVKENNLEVELKRDAMLCTMWKRKSTD